MFINSLSFFLLFRHLPLKEKQKLVKMIPEILGLDDQEFIIVQVAAEKLKPGIMKKLKL
jgi:hypothetical protein